MRTAFMSSQDSTTSDRHWLLLNLTDKMDLQRGHKRVALSHHSIYHTWKKKNASEIINLKYEEQHWMKDLHYLMNLIFIRYSGLS